MKELEFEDFQDYMAGNKEDRHRIFLKYIELYKKTIKAKESQFKKMLSEAELKSDAVLAIDSMFCEIDKRIKEAKKEISLHVLFNKHITQIARNDIRDKQPLSRSVKTQFKKTVSKTKNKDVYEGYENTSVTVPESALVEVDYIGSPDNEHKEHVRELLSIIAPYKNSPIYQDLCDRFIDDKTLREIAEEPRNKGITFQAVSKRMQNYMKRVERKIKEEENNEA